MDQVMVAALRHHLVLLVLLVLLFLPSLSVGVVAIVFVVVQDTVVLSGAVQPSGPLTRTTFAQNAQLLSTEEFGRVLRRGALAAVGVGARRRRFFELLEQLDHSIRRTGSVRIQLLKTVEANGRMLNQKVSPKKKINGRERAIQRLGRAEHRIWRKGLGGWEEPAYPGQQGLLGGCFRGGQLLFSPAFSRLFLLEETGVPLFPTDLRLEPRVRCGLMSRRRQRNL
jgi:hypothetical protein